MSGDVQPRKRKDKKRKKDESTEHVPSQTHTPSINLNEDINIHVHKEEGTGGGICAKIIFFLLFTALAVCIGLIITEHRGLTDLEAAEQESRFSHLFEGWIDNSIGHDDHDDEDDHILSTEDHDEELTSQEGHQDEDEELDDHNEDDEHDDEDEDEEEPEVSEEIAQTEEEDDEEEEEPAETSDEAPRTEEDEDEEDEEDEATAEDEDEDEEQNLSELDGANEEASEENADDNDNEDDEEEDEAESKPDKPSVEDQDDEDNDDEDTIDSKEGETPESDEKENEEPDDNKDEPISKEDEEETPENKDEQPEDDEQNSKLVVKIGVGVALLVVAHVVLVRKWKSATPPSDNSTKDEIPDLSRRNTIIVPPSFQEIKQDMEIEEEYSDEDGEVESDEETDVIKSPKKYGELRTTYARSLTPESEPEYQNKTEHEEIDDEEEEIEEEEEEIEEEEDEEEEDEDEDEDDELDTGYEKDDDEELLKRLEAKYGKLQGGNREDENEEDLEFSSWKRVNVTGDNEAEESESDKQSDTETYEYENITNKNDYKIKEKIDEAHKNIQNNTAYAIKLFDVLLEKYPSSPRSLYGKAQALDLLADQRRSNEILQKSISIYLKILTTDNVPDVLFEAVAQRCINRMRFIGNYHGAIDVHQKLIARFPEVIRHKNQLVVSYLTINKVHKARVLLQEILAKYPNDGFALVHYGFIIKTIDNKLNESISYLQKGIATKDPGVIDGRFYFHLGDALARLGKTEDAMKVYEDGVINKLFLSKYQRSLYNVNRLKSQPWWKKEETPYLNLYKLLENNWKKIREEGISVLNKNGLFQHESENLKDTGDWKQFELFARGQKNINNCKKCPFTCNIIENIPDASGCKRGQTKFSVMHPGTHVWPHCGPTNCRLRVHLGLKVPPNTYIRVAEETRSWEEGKVFIFDDSFEHEVWHNGTSFRLVLIVDVWHPELTSREKKNLSPI